MYFDYKGFNFTDSLCLNESLCIKNFPFFGIKENFKEFKGFSGVIGLGPKSTFM